MLVAAEKRFVFTMDAQEVCAPAFDHFLRHVTITAEQHRGGGGGAGPPPACGERAAGQRAESAPGPADPAVPGLCGRFVDVGGVPRAVGGGGRGEHLVLVELWLPD